MYSALHVAQHHYRIQIIFAAMDGMTGYVCVDKNPCVLCGTFPSTPADGAWWEITCGSILGGNEVLIYANSLDILETELFGPQTG